MTRGSRASAHGENSESFEQNFQRLQEVVQRLSEGNLTLQEALASFEEGMALTESCSRMLDEAELRVKQVSERALRAGQAALAELEGGMRQSLGVPDEPELVTFEVESFETTLIFDAPQSNASDTRGIGPKPTPATNNPKSKIQNPKSFDPLFDEDD